MIRYNVFITLMLLLSSLLSAQQSNNEHGVKYESFSFTKEVTLPGN